MNNEALQAFIAEYGDRIFHISLDDGHKIFFGAPHSDGNVIYATKLQFKTIGGVDYFGISRIDNTWGNNKVPYTTWAVTSYIQFISVVDPDPETGEITEYLPDLNKWF